MLETFPKTGVMGYGFLSFTAKNYKEHHQRSSMAITPGLEK